MASLKCGGVGLNLTEANRVICMDLAWNAATENQAIDRVHRMGQSFVFRNLCCLYAKIACNRSSEVCLRQAPCCQRHD